MKDDIIVFLEIMGIIAYVILFTVLVYLALGDIYY